MRFQRENLIIILLSSLLILTAVACGASGDEQDIPLDGDAVADGDTESFEEDEEAVEQICTPGRWSCYDSQSHWRCNEDGSDFTKLQLCAENELCRNGTCTAPICGAGRWECYDDYSRWRCSDDGFDFLDLELCAPSEICHQGDCIVDKDCTPGEWRCRDSETRWRCNQAGDGFESDEVCSPQFCVNGQCTDETICTPGEWTCYDEQARWRCDEYGAGHVDLSACETGGSCEAGVCLDPEPDGDDDSPFPDGDEIEPDGDEIEPDGDVIEPDGDVDWDVPTEAFSMCNGRTNQSLKDCLHQQIDGHHSLGYDGAKDVIFGDIDHHGGWVECVYTGRRAQIDRPDTQGFNTEHTWPQSMGAGSGDPKADIHHLFPTDSDANSRRSNYPFGNVVDIDWQEGGSKLGDDLNHQRVFEPRDQQKGDTARAILYFSVRYQMSVALSQETAMKQWNRQDPPSDYERTRNDAIEDYQYNRNPFVDRPDFVDAISDF